MWLVTSTTMQGELAGPGAVRGQVQRVYDDLDQKRRTTAYLHAPPILLEPVPELASFSLGPPH